MASIATRADGTVNRHTLRRSFKYGRSRWMYVVPKHFLEFVESERFG
jgi:hypothetical protein